MKLCNDMKRKEIREMGCLFLILQFLVGCVLLAYGVLNVFFRSPIVLFDRKYFQPDVGPGALTLVLGVGFILGAFIKYKERKQK